MVVSPGKLMSDDAQPEDRISEILYHLRHLAEQTGELTELASLLSAAKGPEERAPLLSRIESPPSIIWATTAYTVPAN